MEGNVIVTNDTGHVVDVTFCGELFQVALTGNDYEPGISWNACADSYAMPPGVQLPRRRRRLSHGVLGGVGSGRVCERRPPLTASGCVRGEAVLDGNGSVRP